MKKSKNIAIVTILLFLSICLIEPVTVNAANVKLDKTKLNIYIGETSKLKLKNAKASKIKWTSTKPQIANVSKNGKITAKTEGKSTIIAKYKNKNYKCKVTVVAKEDVNTDTPIVDENAFIEDDAAKSIQMKYLGKTEDGYYSGSDRKCEMIPIYEVVSTYKFPIRIYYDIKTYDKNNSLINSETQYFDLIPDMTTITSLAEGEHTLSDGNIQKISINKYEDGRQWTSNNITEQEKQRINNLYFEYKQCLSYYGITQYVVNTINKSNERMEHMHEFVAVCKYVDYKTNEIYYDCRGTFCVPKLDTEEPETAMIAIRDEYNNAKLEGIYFYYKSSI